MIKKILEKNRNFFSYIFLGSKKNDKKVFNKKVFAVFIVFFSLVLFQHHYMWLYHDDYGYASLSYVGNIYEGVKGINTSLNDIFKFLSFHYMNWGGRVLYFFIECSILKYGMHLFRIIQSLVITGIFYYIYRIVSHILNKKDVKYSILTVCFYGVFEIMMFRNAVFWISASVLYLFPILPFLMFIYHIVLNKKKDGIHLTLIGCFLSFLASFSQEQISAMVLSFMMLYVLYDTIIKKKIDIKKFLFLLSSLTGFCLLLFSPGSGVRVMQTPEFYNLNFIEKFVINFPNILSLNFGEYTRIFTIIFFLCILYISYMNINDKKSFRDLMSRIAFISNGIILSFSIIRKEGYFAWVYNYFENNFFRNLILIIFIVQIILLIFSVVVYFYNKKQVIIIGIFISALASQVVMLFAPYFPLRSAMIMQMTLLIMILSVICEVFKQKKFLILFPTVFMVLVFNYSEITLGYYRNNFVNEYNHKLLLSSSEKISKGEKIEKIKLMKLPDILYSCDQPYIDGFEYIYFFIRQYYDLPEDVEIIYE